MCSESSPWPCLLRWGLNDWLGVLSCECFLDCGCCECSGEVEELSPPCSLSSLCLCISELKFSWQCRIPLHCGKCLGLLWQPEVSFGSDLISLFWVIDCGELKQLWKLSSLACGLASKKLFSLCLLSLDPTLSRRNREFVFFLLSDIFTGSLLLPVRDLIDFLVQSSNGDFPMPE